MAKEGKPGGGGRRLWEGIDVIKDFEYGEDHAEDIEIGDYNREKMIIYSANVNYARMMVRLSDSLKPVERRALYTMYLQGLKPGVKKKSISVVGAVTELHPHGGASVYGTLINMSQYWKRQCPLIRVYGQGGTEVSAIYAADRYTEISLSQYAWDCFFKEYDPDCVQTMFSTSANKDEPVSLPTKYPNFLVNGGTGIAVGNAFCVPPYNIDEIIKETKKMLRNDTGSHVYMVPDFPTGCDIVNDPEALRQICETGKGTLRLRAKTEILDEGKNWAIRVTNLPWGVTQESIVNAIVKATKTGKLAVKDVQDRSDPIWIDAKTVVSHVNLYILVDKAHDPYAVREKLFKMTLMEDTLSVDFNVVLEELKLDKLSLGDLIRTWIRVRREYKRRLLNKRIAKTSARIELLKILIEMCQEKNIHKSTSIITKSGDDKVVSHLMKEYGMSSYQAERILDMRMGAISADAKKRYEKELKEKEDELKDLYKMVKSEKYIDDIIAAELDELKKYGKPRQSQLVDIDKKAIVDTETEYFLVATKRGGLKKVSVNAVELGKKGFGNFEQKDYPTHILRVKNLDTVLFVDSFGKFSVIPAGDVDTMALTDLPGKAFEATKLEGEIIAMIYFQGDAAVKWMKKAGAGTLYLVTASRDGMVKKMPVTDLMAMTNNGAKAVRNMRLSKLKTNDFLAHVGYYIDSTPIIFYTKKGEFNYVRTSQIHEYGTAAVGTNLINLQDEDAVVGCCAVDPDAKYLVVVTEKGAMKKCEIDYIGSPSGSKATSYLATVDAHDNVVYVDTPKKSVDVCTRLRMETVQLDEIKTLGRKAKPVKKISLGTGDNIIRVVTH